MPKQAGKTLLEGLSHDRTRHGKVRWFYRTKFGKKQLRGIHDAPPLTITQDVLDAYMDARERLEGLTGVNRTPGSLGWLLDRYIDSISHLSPLTIADRKSIAKGMMHHQHRPFRNIRLKHAHVIRDEVGLNVGNKRVKLLRYAYDWAVEQELMAENPVRAAKTRSNPTEGYTSWTPDDVATFIDRHPLGTKAHLALSLFTYSGGTRISDVARFGPMNIKGDRVEWVQKKGRGQQVRRRSVPLVAALRKVLAASELGQVTWLQTEYGKPFSIKGLGQWFRKRCDEAGLRHLSAHGIRKAVGSVAAEHGCTAHQIMEFLGISLKEAETYTRAANAKKLADDGFNKVFGDD